MSELQVCEACRRHIRVSERVCPFCTEQVTKRSPLGAARNVILASALAGASAMACSDERPATKAPPPVDEPASTPASDAAAAKAADDTIPAMPYGAPPPPPIADAAPADAGAVDAAVAKKQKKRKAKSKVIKSPLPAPMPDPPPMPYGAPPARRRMV